jgi:hypothetical protein
MLALWGEDDNTKRKSQGVRAWWVGPEERDGPPVGVKRREGQGEEGCWPRRDGLVRLEGGFLFKSFSLFLFKPVLKKTALKPG